MKIKTIIILTLATLPVIASNSKAAEEAKAGPAEEVLSPMGYYKYGTTVSAWLADSIAKDRGLSAGEYVRQMYSVASTLQKDVPSTRLPEMAANSSLAAMNLLTISVAQNAKLIEQNEAIIALLSKIAAK